MNDSINQKPNIEIFNLESLLCCPYCRKAFDKQQSSLFCKSCNISFPIKEGIYYFNIKNELIESSFFKKEWNDRLENIDEYKNPTVSQKIDALSIRQKAPSINNKILLDAGCGTGLSTFSLLNDDVNIIFIDIVPEALKFIKELIKLKKIKANVLLLVGDLTALPIKSKSADIIWSGGVLEHFQDLKKPYVELYRVLKSPGDLIFSIPNKFGIQRILSSIKEKIVGSTEDHFERGFVYFRLNGLFPKKFFLNHKIEIYGIEQTYNELLLPLIRVKLPKFFYSFYRTLTILFTRILPQIKLSVSWFLLHGKKK